MGYADDETRGIPRAMHANGFSRPTRLEARLREERERERERRALFWLPRVRTSPETVMVGQIVDRIAPTHVGWERRGNKCKRSRKRNRNRGSKEIVAV